MSPPTVLPMTKYYAYIETAVICPVCGNEFENTEEHIRVQIGALERWYRIGDAIKWSGEAERARLAGLAPIYVFDRDPHYSIWRCRACGTLFDSPAVIVESEHITGVRLMTHAQARALFGLDRGLVDIVGYDDVASKWVLVE